MTTKEEILAAAAKRLHKVTPQKLMDKAFRLWAAQQQTSVLNDADRILKRVSTPRLLMLYPKMPDLVIRHLGGDWYIPGTTGQIRQFVAVSLARLRWHNRVRRRPELAFNLTTENAEAYYMGMVRDAINVTSGMYVGSEEGGVLTISIDLNVAEDGSVPYEAEVKLHLDGENHLVLHDGYSGNTITRWPVSNPQQVVRHLEDMVTETDRLLNSSIESSLPAL